MIFYNIIEDRLNNEQKLTNLCLVVPIKQQNVGWSRR